MHRVVAVQLKDFCKGFEEGVFEEFFFWRKVSCSFWSFEVHQNIIFNMIYKDIVAGRVMIEIDGKYSGGQTLRTALSLSAITKIPFKMTNIRGKRENPGLQLQHLTAVNAMGEICDAHVEGNNLRSNELEFTPGEVKGGKYKFDIQSAGSATLIFQALLPVLLFAEKESEVEVRGGTANPLAPPALEIKEVFLYFLKKAGIEVEFEILEEGFYPKGGGRIKFKVNPVKKLRELSLLERGSYLKTEIIALASEELEKADVASRITEGVRANVLMEKNVLTEEIYKKTLSPGCYVHVNGEFENTKLGFTVLGERGKKAEDVGRECAKGFLEIVNSDATADRFTADQLLMYLALAGGGCFVTDHVTDHLRTNASLIERFLPVRFKIKEMNVECLSVQHG